jgi:CubicO group peptidase (beta-lactamase class C family)
MLTQSGRTHKALFALATAALALLLVPGGCRYESGGAPGRGAEAVGKRTAAILGEAFPESMPGAAVIVQRAGETLLRSGYGMADLELAVPFDAGMVSRIGSATKTFTATAVMMLVEDGRVSLQDPVRTYLPRLPEAFDPVRIKHLLSNTSGIPDYMHTEDFARLIETQYHDIVNEEVDLDTIFAIISHSAPAFLPGERYSYSNSNFFLLAMVIEEATGEAYFDFLMRCILEPAGMTRTYYAAGATFVPGRVPVHLEYEGQIIKSPHRCMGSTLGFGCGGLWSTVDDLARFDRALASGELLEPETLARMFAPCLLNDGTEARYGLGWQVGKLRGKPIALHGGDYIGYSALVMRVPSEDIFIGILSNDGDLHAFNLEYPAKKIAALLFGDPFPEWQAIEMPPEKLATYAGTYRMDESNVREFIVEDGRAYTQRNGRGKLEIYPASDSTFFYTITLSYIEFEFDEAGAPVRMIMHHDSGSDRVAERVE